jgi:hypothetical protein
VWKPAVALHRPGTLEAPALLIAAPQGVVAGADVWRRLSRANAEQAGDGGIRAARKVLGRLGAMPQRLEQQRIGAL